MALLTPIGVYMCASCGCDNVNNVGIPGNKSGLGSGTSGKIAKQDVIMRGESKKHERSEMKNGKYTEED